MTTAQLGAIIRGFAPAIRDAIAAAAGSLDARMTALERREPVAGKDGAPGPQGPAGSPGKNGLGFDEFDVALDADLRTFRVKLALGDRVFEKTFALPVVLDRGVWLRGKTYEPGDAVSYEGSLWIAQVETAGQPGTTKDWRLAVKHGRDGREGKSGPAGPAGKDGRDGLDLTQVGPDGKKWR